MRATLALAFIAAMFAQASPADSPRETAIFAGGCFWCVESDFEKLDGVIEVVSGYTDGHTENPTYKDIGTGTTGHVEAAEITYDPTKVTYPELLDYFWRHIDPTVENRQFCDSGSQYRSGIYWKNDEQRKAAQKSLKTLQESGRFKQIYTELKPASRFWKAEEYHQDYYKKNPVRYRFYRFNCGRDARVEELWGDTR